MSDKGCIPVYNIGCRCPKQGEEVVWFKRHYSFGYYGFEPCFTRVEYYWQDEDGTGVGYNGEDESYMRKVGFTLHITFDGCVVGPDDKYTPLDDWFTTLEGEGSVPLKEEHGQS